MERPGEPGAVAVWDGMRTWRPGWCLNGRRSARATSIAEILWQRRDETESAQRSVDQEGEERSVTHNHRPYPGGPAGGRLGRMVRGYFRGLRSWLAPGASASGCRRARTNRP